jgi:hypothetical protein
MSPEERDDELLQKYLDGDSALSRLYRLGAREKPDAQLDAKILAAARRSLTRKSSVARSPFARNWVVPTSLAAVVVLSVSVLLLVPDPGGGPTLDIDGAGKQAPAPMTNAPGDASRAAAPRPAPASAPPAASAGGRRDQTLEAETKAGEESTSGSAPRQSTISGQDANGGIGKRERKPRTAERKSSDAGAAQVLPQALPQASSAGSIAEQDAAKTDREALPAVQPSPVVPHPEPPMSVQDEPRAWLHYIEALLDEQDDETGARSNLRAFIYRYPDIPLPTRLANLAASMPAP